MNKEIATFAGGCFWCTEAVFKRIKGVISVKSGYTGGAMKNPTYKNVTTGQTGHAEAIEIEFDPKIISFKKLLDIFWATHDPTTLNKQGADVGTQYRSAIFYHNQKQKEIALNSKEKMEKSNQLKIVTQLLPFDKFYTAEEYHQNFYDTNPTYPYCALIINPKIEKLIKRFDEDVKKEYYKK